MSARPCGCDPEASWVCEEHATRNRADLLRTSLAAAVPLWQDQLRSRPLGEVLARAPTLAHTIVGHGDDILYKSKRPGDTAAAFNALAEAVAVCSFVPGGVTVFGDHYEAMPHVVD